MGNVRSMGRIAVTALHALTGAVALALSSAPALAEPTAQRRAKLDEMFAAADALDEAANPAAYRKAFEQVLAFARTLYPQGHPELAWVEAELATADYLQGDVRGGAARLDRIAAVLDAAGPEWRERRMLIANAQVVMHLTLSEFDRATALGQQVLDWRIATSNGQPSTNLAAAWSNLANAQIRNGETDKAIASVREAIAINRRLSPIPANAAPHFANLVTFLYSSGQLEEAAEEGRKTQALLESFLPQGHPFLAVNLNTMARVLMDLGRLDEAEAAARKGMDLAYARFGESQQTLSYLATLANVLAANGKTAEAQNLARAAADKMAQDLGPEADRALLARETLAMTLAAEGDATRALAEYTAVSEVRSRRYPAHHRDRIESEDRLAIAAFEAGDAARARTVQQGAQDLRQAGGQLADTAALVGEARLAAFEALGGDAPAGLARARTAAEGLDARLREMEATGARRSGLDRSLRTGFGWALEAAAVAGDAAAAFTLAQPVVEGSAGIAARAAARRMAALDPVKAALLRERQDGAVAVQTLLDKQLRLAALGTPADRLAAVDAERAAATARLDALTLQLAELAPDLVRSEASERLTLLAAQALLAKDEALLIVAPGPQGLVVLAANGKDATVVRSAPTRRATALVKQLRKGLENPGTFDHAASAELRTMILPDSITRIIGKRKRLLISTGGSFSSLPFAVLTDGTPKQPRWLIEDHALVTLPALTTLSAKRTQAQKKPRGFLALGAPQLNAGTSAPIQLASATPFRSAANAQHLADLPPLPASANELAALGQALGARSSTVLTGEQATEAALRSADLAGIDVLALSTHGLVAGELDGLHEPALVLTPVGDGDGLLTTDEIMDLRLSGAWVVLSACNTAAGSGVDGSGLGGLARAFLHAGAANLLVSHWAVRDDVAARLSVATLSQYAQGKDPAAALQRAMIGMAKARDATLRDPALWAPFVVVGR